MDKTVEHGTTLNESKITYLNGSLLPTKVTLNPNFFIPDEQKVFNYLHLDRSYTTFEPDFAIPVGDGYVKYSGFEKGGVNDRTLDQYQRMLFPDEFDDLPPSESKGWSPEVMLRQALRRQYPKSIFEGYDDAFKSGKTVLDIGSGQAFALIQLALEFPNTSFIGVDILYKQHLPVFPGLHGLQLTHGDWKSLSSIPDKTIDTILGCQSVGMWGLRPPFSDINNRKDGKQIIKAWERVAKPGAVVRIDDIENFDSIFFIAENMTRDKWEINTSGKKVVFKMK